MSSPIEQKNFAGFPPRDNNFVQIGRGDLEIDDSKLPAVFTWLPSLTGESSMIIEQENFAGFPARDDNFVEIGSGDPVKHTRICTPLRPLVDYSSSSDEEISDEALVSRSSNNVEGIYVGENECVDADEQVKMIVVRTNDKKTIDQSVFQATPWNLKKKPQVQAPSTSRKVRPRQSSELMTSEEIVAKQKAKDLKKWKTRSSSDSKERRITRNLAKSQKREL